MGTYKDLTGQKFGRLTVLKRADNGKNKQSYWLCLCDCGNKKIVRRDSLISNKTISCGCLQKENSKKANTKHGFYNTRIYDIYLGMIARCNNQNRRNYKYYGGRDIQVCKEWLDNFMNFYTWAIKNGYTDNLTIDRINFNNNYEPSNCRWVSWEVQYKNKRKKQNAINKR